MKVKEFLAIMNSGAEVAASSPTHAYMSKLSEKARRITVKLNRRYRTPKTIRKLFSALIGKTVDETFRLFPPFYTDCGKNIAVGKNVFINACCLFQDQGGITIGDGTLIGHSVILATLNHHPNPSLRDNLIPKPIVIGKKVWIGANATILPGITIGDGAVVAAGAVVTKDVEVFTVVGGNPARPIKTVATEE